MTVLHSLLNRQRVVLTTYFNQKKVRGVLLMISVFSLLLHSGCQGIQSGKPPIRVPKQWPANAFTHSKAVDLAHLYWWKQFQNAELDVFMQKTLINNSELKTALTRVEQAQNQLDQIKLSWIPGVSFLTGYSQFPNLGNPGAIAIAYPAYIVNLLQLYKQTSSAKALYQASIYAKDGVTLALLARTAASFFIVLEQMESLTIHHQLLLDSERYLKALNTQYNSGLIAHDKIAQQKSKIKLIQSQMDLIRYNLVVAKNALHYLFDENPGTLQINSSLKQINTQALIPGNQPLSVLANRPDVRQAEALLKASHADTDALKATFFPQINLGAYLGTSGQGRVNLGQAYAEGPLINVPMIAQIKGAKARDQEYYLRYRDTIKQALRDVANDFAAFTAYSAQLRTNTMALDDAKQQCHTVSIRYQHGLDDSLASLQCIIAMDELVLTVNHNKLEQLIALVGLYQDLAGGYSGH
jgi:outer membrane protein, multidrug efflux system